MAEVTHLDKNNLPLNSNTSCDGTVTENMIADVLAICPDVARGDVIYDLRITASVTRTINRILDGQFPAAVLLDSGCRPSAVKSLNQESCKADSTTSEGTVISNKLAEPLKPGELSSDTELYTDTDEDDVLIVNQERKTLFTALKKRLNSSHTERYPCDDLLSTESTPMHTKKSISRKREACDNTSKGERTSAIIDLSDENKVASEQGFGCKRAQICHTERTGNYCNVAEPFQGTVSKMMHPTSEKHLQKAYLEKLGEQFADSFAFDHHSDSDSSDSADLPCMLRSSVSIKRVEHQTRSGTHDFRDAAGVRQTSVTTRIESEIPSKKKKRSAEEVIHQRKEALLKKQAREQMQQAKKEEKEREKQARQQARSEMRIQKEKEKLMKKAGRMNQMTNRLDGCVKQIIVCVDPDLLENGRQSEESVLLSRLEALGANYQLQPKPCPSSVTWQRTLLEHNVAETLQISAKTSFADEDHVVVRLSALKFVEMVFRFREEQKSAMSFIAGEQTLLSFCREVLQIYSRKIVTIFIMGLEKYFRDVKLSQQRKFRSAALGSGASDTEKPSGKGQKRNNKKPGPSVVVSRVDVEEALVDLQLREPNCRVRMCETEEEFAELLAMFTKAIAEAPFKKKQPETFSFCVEGGDRGSVKVSKDGHGLQKVWMQQLQQFRNVSADMAAAIAAVYPTPQSVLQAYRQCRSTDEASKLLKDIVVRRGAGVLATSRRIGPELSRRIHMLFTSEDGHMSMQ